MMGAKEHHHEQRHLPLRDAISDVICSINEVGIYLQREAWRVVHCSAGSQQFLSLMYR